jgi:hypothetical protein
MRFQGTVLDLAIDFLGHLGREHMHRPPRRIFGLVVIKAHRRDNIDDAERHIAHDGAGQLAARHEGLDQYLVAIECRCSMSPAGGALAPACTIITPTLEPSSTGLIT